MIEEEKKHWLTKRLKELGKSKTEFAKALGVNGARIYELENGLWKLQVSHIKKAAEFLQFDRMAFLDFVSGDITEEQLWSYQPQTEISVEDMELLKAVKTIYARPREAETAKNIAQSTTLPRSEDRNR